jgi:hypothetical protein
VTGVAFLNYKSDLIVAVSVGILIEFILWLLFCLPVSDSTIGQFMWLEHLQAPWEGNRSRGLAYLVWSSRIFDDWGVDRLNLRFFSSNRSVECWSFHSLECVPLTEAQTKVAPTTPTHQRQC